MIVPFPLCWYCSFLIMLPILFSESITRESDGEIACLFLLIPVSKYTYKSAFIFSEILLLSFSLCRFYPWAWSPFMFWNKILTLFYSRPPPTHWASTFTRQFYFTIMSSHLCHNPLARSRIVFLSLSFRCFLIESPWAISSSLFCGPFERVTQWSPFVLFS